MDKASGSGAGDSRFESWADQRAHADMLHERAHLVTLTGWDASAIGLTRRATYVPHHVATEPGARLLRSWSVGLMGGSLAPARTGQKFGTV